jgi:hypothetical protein
MYVVDIEKHWLKGKLRKEVMCVCQCAQKSTTVGTYLLTRSLRDLSLLVRIVTVD